jgi:hypothetical protein
MTMPTIDNMHNEHALNTALIDSNFSILQYG